MRTGKVTLIIAVTITLLITVFQAGCIVTQPGKVFEVGSNTYFKYVIPAESSNTFFQANFYKVCGTDYLISEDEYIVGRDVLLFGEGVDQLAGSSVFVSKQKLSKYTKLNNEYYSSVLAYENERYGRGRDIKNKDVRAAKKILKPYAKCAYVYSFYFSYNKNEDENEISAPIKVERLEFSDVNVDLSFDFDIFEINVKDIPKDESDIIRTSMVSDLAGNLISSGGATGVTGVSAIVEGMAIEEIKKIDVIALDDDMVLASDENRNRFRELEEETDQAYYWPKKSVNFAVGEKIDINRQLVFADILGGRKLIYDTVSILYGATFTDMNDKTYVRYDCVSTVGDSSFLMADLLHEKLT